MTDEQVADLAARLLKNAVENIELTDALDLAESISADIPTEEDAERAVDAALHAVVYAHIKAGESFNSYYLLKGRAD